MDMIYNYEIIDPAKRYLLEFGMGGGGVEMIRTQLAV